MFDLFYCLYFQQLSGSHHRLTLLVAHQWVSPAARKSYIDLVQDPALFGSYHLSFLVILTHSSFYQSICSCSRGSAHQKSSSLRALVRTSNNVHYYCFTRRL